MHHERLCLDGSVLSGSSFRGTGLDGISLIGSDISGISLSEDLRELRGASLDIAQVMDIARMIGITVTA